MTSNVDIARELYDAVNRRDWAGFVARTHPEVESESRLAGVEGGYHGHAGLRRWWDDFFQAFPDYEIELEELRDLGDFTLACMRGTAHGAGSRTPLDDSAWMSIEWGDGKVTWWRTCPTEADALEAIRARSA